MRTKENCRGFTLAEIIIVICIIVVITVIAMPFVNLHINDRELFRRYFEMSCPGSPDDDKTIRPKVVETLVFMRDKVTSAESEKTNITARLEKAPKSTAEDIMKYADLQNLLDEQSTTILRLKAEYSSALYAAYYVGFVKETTAMGYKPPNKDDSGD